MLKSVFDRSVVDDIAGRIGAVHKTFEREAFVKETAAALGPLELKERSALIARSLARRLPRDFRAALGVLVASLGPDDGGGGIVGFGGFRYLPYNNFVGLHGLEDPDASLDALELFTKYFSAEFDIRSFIVRHPDKTLRRIRRWSRHDDWRVRRLASEGTRPRLPWAPRLPEFVSNPSWVLSLLEGMRSEPHEAVRRSIANSLNDISKDHPDRVLALAEAWLTENNSEAPRVAQIRHALRTLTRKGDARALKLLGVDAGNVPRLRTFELRAKRSYIGGELIFDYQIEAEREGRYALTYAIHYVKASGRISAKIFRLTEKDLAAGEVLSGTKRHSLRQMTTRRHYPGRHAVELRANGTVLASRGFDLTDVASG